MENIKLIELCNKYGTPLYVYDQTTIESKYEKLKKHFHEDSFRFFYACKALSNINILRILKNKGAGLDTVSIGEVEMGIKAGFLPKDILFTPNCVCFEELELAINKEININIDSISILEKFGAKYKNTYPIIIRFNPHILAGGNFNISTGHIDSKFGISIHQLRHVLRIVKAFEINVVGLHMHTGSEIKDIDIFMQGMEIMLDMVDKFDSIQILDLGSGFKVPYKDGEKESDIELLSLKIKERLLQYNNISNTKLQIWFEPGKYLVSEAGMFLAKVNVVKPTPATNFIGLNSGFNHLIRPMFYNSYHKIVNISNKTEIDRIYTIVGNLCETDTFAYDRQLNETNEGDIIMFQNAGAYCFEMSMNYNSRPKPAEVLIRDNKDYLIRKRESFEDLQKNIIEIL